MVRYGKSIALGTTVVAAGASGALAYSFRSSYQKPNEFSQSYNRCDAVPSYFRNASIKQPALVLTPEQRAQFATDGYLVVKGVIPTDYVECVREQANYYARNYQGVQKWFTRFSGRSAIHGPSHHAGWARALVTNHICEFGLPNIAAQLMSPTSSSNDSPKLRLVLDTLDIIKKGQVSASTAPFRKDKNIHSAGVRIWIPLDHITKDSAPTVVVPGSHRWQTDCQTGHFEAGNKLSLCPGFKQLMEECGYWKPVVVAGMNRGDALFIDTRVLHGWAPNTRIDPFRLALRLTIKPDSSNFYQPIKFHNVGPLDVVAPQIWPHDAETQLAHDLYVKEGVWPVPEPPFSEFAAFSVAMLGSAFMHRVFTLEPFRPYGPIHPADTENSNSQDNPTEVKSTSK